MNNPVHKKYAPVRHVSKNSQQKKGFTLIEVLVASLILSGVFFAILKLISSNTHQATNLEHSRIMDSLFLSSKTCLESFGYDTLSGTTGTESLNFGSDNLGCFTGSYDSGLSFTGIPLERKSGTETGSTTFWSYFNVTDNTGTLKIYNSISDGIETKNYDFVIAR